MAGDWIKVRDDLPDDIEVIHMAAKSGLSSDDVVGKLIRFWSWVDRHMIDCHAPGVTNVFVDHYVRHDGFAQILSEVGWLKFDEGGMDIPNFERHLSECAKRRALNAERKTRERDKCHAGGVTKTRPEKRREREEDDDDTPPSPSFRKEECIGWSEHMRIWNEEIAPLLRAPAIRKLSKKRQVALGARLKEFPDLWDQIRAEAILVAPRYLGEGDGSIRFLDFDFLTTDSKLTKFLEGKYRRKTEVMRGIEPKAADDSDVEEWFQREFAGKRPGRDDPAPEVPPREPGDLEVGQGLPDHQVGPSG